MTSPPAEDELLTPGGVAALLYVGPKTVTRWARSGKLAYIRTPGGHRRYRRSDVLAIRAGTQPHATGQHARPAIPLPRRSGGASEDLDAPDRSGELAAAVVAEAVTLAVKTEAANAAQAVISVASAVSTAADIAAAAAERARQTRAAAAAEAANLMADQNARAARTMRIQADLNAGHVANDAALAMQHLMDSDEEEDPARAASVMGEKVAAAARASAQDTLRAAETVSSAVAAAAVRVEQLAMSADDAFEDLVASTAEAILQLTTHTANRVAHETEVRAAGVAATARQAAAALQGQLPSASATVQSHDENGA
jgi:excisionase family DNA binding protein